MKSELYADFRNQLTKTRKNSSKVTVPGTIPVFTRKYGKVEFSSFIYQKFFVNDFFGMLYFNKLFQRILNHRKILHFPLCYDSILMRTKHFTVFGVIEYKKILNFFYADPGSGMEKNSDLG